MVYINWCSVIMLVIVMAIEYIYGAITKEKNKGRVCISYVLAEWVKSRIDMDKKTMNMISRLSVGRDINEAVTVYYSNIVNRVLWTVLVVNLFCILSYENSVLIMFLGLLSVTSIILLRNNELKDKLEERNNQMLIDYSIIVNKFALLLNAGLNVKNSWKKICLDYESKILLGENVRYAYEEMRYTYNEILNGQMEIRAYASFGKRIGISQYHKFGSLLSQSIVRGNEYIVNTLENEADKVLSERKDMIKQNGEKLGTKLMLPMMIFLVIALLLVMIPAFTNI